MRRTHKHTRIFGNGINNLVGAKLHGQDPVLFIPMKRRPTTTEEREKEREKISSNQSYRLRNNEGIKKLADLNQLVRIIRICV